MAKFQVAYVPIGVPTFHLESAQKEFMESIALLQSVTDAVVCPDEILLSMERLQQFLDGLHPDLIILQNTTFANAAYASEVLKRFDCPLLLWTLREPVTNGGRLRLNSLTGAYSAANAIRNFREDFVPFEFVLGSSAEEQVADKIKAAIAAAKCKKELKDLRLAVVGHTPQGFGFGRALDLEMMKSFGVSLETIEVREMIDAAKHCTDEEAEKYLEDASHSINGLEAIPEKNCMDFARLYKAYKDYAEKNNIGALASRCWPDFFTAFGTPVCAVIALLNDLGVAAACEADAYGALSMYLGMHLSGRPVFFGDPVSMDEDKNTITYWHCGTAACSLARTDTGAKAGVHCNRKIGPTLDFGCMSSEAVTVFRIGRKSDGSFRFFLMRGEALDAPKQFHGTSAVVRTESSVKKVINDSVMAGWEPHFVVIYKDVAAELEMLAHMLNMEVCNY